MAGTGLRSASSGNQIRAASSVPSVNWINVCSMMRTERGYAVTIKRSSNSFRCVKPSELEFGAVDVSKSFQRIRPQSKAKPGPVWGVHHPVRPDVKRLVEQFPHHRHVALCHLEDVAIGSGHCDMNTGRE